MAATIPCTVPAAGANAVVFGFTQLKVRTNARDVDHPYVVTQENHTAVAVLASKPEGRRILEQSDQLCRRRDGSQSGGAQP